MNATVTKLICNQVNMLLSCEYKMLKREIGKYVDEQEVARYLDYVFVPVELNTSSEDDIKALPGIGKKMTHEFLEYRPYKNLAQFRKEIGKVRYKYIHLQTNIQSINQSMRIKKD